MRRAVIALLLCGCGGTEPDEAEGSGTASTGPTGTVEVGNGIDDHQALAEGAEVVMMHGGQGGWHVEASGLVVGLGDTVFVQTRLEGPDGALWGESTDSPVLLANYDEAADSGIFVHAMTYTGVVCHDDHDTCSRAGQTAMLCAHIANAADTTLWADGCTQVTLALDPNDVALCAAIDDGSWYPGWPVCELTDDCSQKIDPACDNAAF